MPLSLLVAVTLGWPVDMVHDVEAGREKFVKVSAVEWAEVDDPAIATVEVMGETQEVLISGVKPGRALILLYAEGKIGIWRVRVSGKPEVLPTDAAKKACPDLKLTPAAETKLTVTVGTDACWKALDAFFRSDTFLARELDVTFEGKVLQAQLKGLQAVLKKDVQSKYVGAGLVLEGDVTVAEHRATLWQVFKNTVGRVALDDRLEIKPP